MRFPLARMGAAAMPDKINILVVDDSPDKLMSLVAVLEELGENVVAAHSGRDALRRLLDEEFAVILLDVNMPDIDGFETAALIRRRKKTEHIPIIFITAYGDDTHASQGYSLGAVDYILAPIIPEVLRAKVSVFVDLCRKNEQVLRQAEQRVALVREQAARAAAEDATRRFSMLAEASSFLSRSLDLDATMDGVIRLYLQRFADQVAVTLADEQGRIGPTEWGWRIGDQPSLRVLQPHELDTRYAASIETLLASEAELPPTIAAPTTAEGVGAPITARHQATACGSGILIPLVARGRILGVLALFRELDWHSLPPVESALVYDLADRAAIALDNARLYRRIQDGDRRKDEFVAMLAHELRNPLGAISNSLECLRLADADESLAATAREVLTRQVEQMTHLVDDLLDVSRITRGKVELKKEWIDLGSLVARAVATTRHIVAARDHTVAVQLPERSVQLYVDPTRFEQVLANLLHNAAKFTNPGGRIAVSAQVHGGELALSVRDNGIGIPAHVLARVFDLFAQGEHPLDRSQGGLGIGLTLVRSLVELHGGRIEAFSCGDRAGSEFLIRLPLPIAPSTAMTRAEPEPTIDEPPLSRRVLVVDDNVDVALTLVALLRHSGHDVQVRHDGLAAVEAALADSFDVIFVDIGLPGMSGYDVARRLRGELSAERPYLVAVTGYGQEEDRRRSSDAGFNLHLVKPVRLHDIQQVLSELSVALPATAVRA